MNKTWPFTFNFLIFAAFAFSMPFMVLYYQRAGFTGAQIGLVTGITPLITLLSTPLWTTLADATRRHRLSMSLALLIGAITIAAFPFLNIFGAWAGCETQGLMQDRPGAGGVPRCLPACRAEPADLARHTLLVVTTAPRDRDWPRWLEAAGLPAR